MGLYPDTWAYMRGITVWDLPHCQSHPKNEDKQVEKSNYTKKTLSPSLTETQTQHATCHGKPENSGQNKQKRTGPNGGWAGRLQANTRNTGQRRNMWQLSTTGKARASCFAGSFVHPRLLGRGGGLCPRCESATLLGGAHSSSSVSGCPICRSTTGPDAKGNVGERTSTVMSRPPPKNWHAWPLPPATGQVHQLLPPDGPASKSPMADPDPSMAGRHDSTPALKQTCEDSSNTQFLSLTIPASPALDSNMPCIHTPIDVVSFTRLLTDHLGKAFSTFVSRGLESGFSIALGFMGRRQTVTDPNLPSCIEHSLYILEYLVSTRPLQHTSRNR